MVFGFCFLYKKQENRKLGPDGREFLYVPLKGSLSPFSGPWELPTTAGEEIWGSVSLLLLFIFFSIVACMKMGSIWMVLVIRFVWDSKERFSKTFLFEFGNSDDVRLNNNIQNTIFFWIWHFFVSWTRARNFFENPPANFLVLSPRQGLGYFKSAR